MEEVLDKEKKEFIFQSKLFFGIALFVLAYSVGQYVKPFYIVGNYIQNAFLIVLMIYLLIVIGGAFRDQLVSFNNVATISILGLALAGFVSCMVNDNKDITIYGDEFQGAGWLILLSYYCLFLAASLIRNIRYRKAILYFMILVFSCICFFGILQYFNLSFIIHSKLVSSAAIYPTRNQNAFAVFPVYLFGLLFGLILYGNEYNYKQKILCYCLIGLSFAAALCAVSSLVYVAFIMQFLLAAFLELVSKRKKYTTILMVLLECIIIFLIFNVISNGGFLAEFLSVSNQIKEEGSLVADSIGSGRMYIWKATIRDLPKHWLFGCGIEKFIVWIDNNPHMPMSLEAHNGYLHLWMEQGIFAIVFYLVFLFALFIPGILQFVKKERYESDFVTKAAFIAFFGFIAQDFVNINTLHVGPYFWPICGLLFLPRKKKQQTDLSKLEERIESEQEVKEKE